MSKKIALIAFRGEVMCFVHVLLNAQSFYEKGYSVKIIMEGMATALVKELNDANTPFGKRYRAVRDMGLIDCVCRACATQTGSLESAQAQGLVMRDEMAGHPALESYAAAGYTLLTF